MNATAQPLLVLGDDSALSVGFELEVGEMGAAFAFVAGDVVGAGLDQAEVPALLAKKAVVVLDHYWMS